MDKLCPIGTLASMSDMAKILERWMELDRLLNGSGLKIRSFAKDEDISEKTVRRYLSGFREFGMELECRRGRDGYLWYYTRGKGWPGPLFNAKIRKRRRAGRGR